MGEQLLQLIPCQAVLLGERYVPGQLLHPAQRRQYGQGDQAALAG